MWTLVDTIAVVLLALGTAVGWRRRLSGELAHVLSLIVAVAVGLFASRPLGQWLLEHSRLSPGVAWVVAFLGVLILSALAMAATRALLRKTMRVVFEEEVDKYGGAVAGFVRAAVVLALVFLVVNMTANETLRRVFGERSFFGRLAIRYAPALEETVRQAATENGRE